MAWKHYLKVSQQPWYTLLLAYGFHATHPFVSNTGAQCLKSNPSWGNPKGEKPLLATLGYRHLPRGKTIRQNFPALPTFKGNTISFTEGLHGLELLGCRLPLPWICRETCIVLLYQG